MMFPSMRRLSVVLRLQRSCWLSVLLASTEIAAKAATAIMRTALRFTPLIGLLRCLGSALESRVQVDKDHYLGGFWKDIFGPSVDVTHASFAAPGDLDGDQVGLQSGYSGIAGAVSKKEKPAISIVRRPIR